MRKIVPCIALLITLSACGGGGRVLADGGTGLNTREVCHEQSRWATVGKMDGGDISITCADGYNAR
jgi:hypothetical protein